MDESEVISISVMNPRTHLRNRWPQFTDYEIQIHTNSSVFACQDTSVRRRYSEFEWLKRTLEKHNPINIKPPCLPSKKLLGRFNKEFIKKRQLLLEDFLVRIVAVTSYLSELALHLFLQSQLSLKSIERILDGRDTREAADIIIQGARERARSDPIKGTTPHRCGLKRQGSQNTANTDSGFSGSMQCVSQSTDLNSCSSCQELPGNGWSSGVTLEEDITMLSSVHLCPQPRLQNHAATVLPTGQLVTALDAGFGLTSPSPRSHSDTSEHCREKHCKKCYSYDADDETDADIIDYDVINARKLRVKKWLSTMPLPDEFYSCEETASEDDVFVSLSGETENWVPEYDVISVPCCNKQLARYSSQTTGYPSEHDTSSKDDDSERSVYSVVHSSIGGLELQTTTTSTQESPVVSRVVSAASSLSSAAAFKTYDVIEMIEVRS